VAKWLAYVDKFLFFPRRLRARIAAGATLVHICDHSNAVYTSHCRPLPVLVTCHDLLAVRGALGEETDTPASKTGGYLQKWILAGLRKAKVVACVSDATCADVQRLLGTGASAPRLSTIVLGLNYPYTRLPRAEAATRLRGLPGLELERPFVLHVGSNIRRKNREAVLRIFARTKEQWDGQLVLAGEALGPELRALGEELGIASRIVQVVNPANALLEALYNCATALVYPSRFEGFGWPIAEAQACGCPVICSDRGPLPEVAGSAGLIHPVEDEEAFAADILRLTDPAVRARWSMASLQNAERFMTERMIAEYVQMYRTMVPQW
jgi:glycosyltransferase involved in cell wall biosynthesis